MRKRSALSCFAGLALAVAGSGQAQTPTTPKLPRNVDQLTVPEKVVDVGDGIHVVTGLFNNTTVAEGGRGLVVIDTQFAPRYPAIAARIAEISAKPVIYVINTHYHYDHTGANAAFHAHGAEIVSHANVPRRMAAPPPDPITGAPEAPAPTAARPTRTYDGPETTLDAGGLKVRLIHPAPAHTDGDTIVVFPMQDVVCTGDIVGNHYPNIDLAVGGGIDGTIRATDMIIGLLDDRTRVIPGHGPVLKKADVIAYRRVLQTARDRIARAKARGMAEAQLQSANLLADFDPVWKGPSPLSAKFALNVYRSLP